jgi:hypothetical protein
MLFYRLNDDIYETYISACTAFYRLLSFIFDSFSDRIISESGAVLSWDSFSANGQYCVLVFHKIPITGRRIFLYASDPIHTSSRNS